VSTEFLPTPPTGYWGGTESVVYDLACALVELGNEVTLIARPGSSSPGELITTFQDVPDSLLGVNERHFNAYASHVAHFKGVVHDHSNGKMAGKIHPKVLNTMRWCQHPHSAGYRNISAVSHAQARWLEERMPQGRKIPVVHHGINLERFLYREDKGDYYLFFSVLSGYKGAFDALLLAKETGVKIVFAGKDGDASVVINSVNRPNIIYRGQVSNEERAKLMSRAKALIFPTGGFGSYDWLEVFGLVQLEALSSGTPVVSSDCGASPEIIQDGVNGFVCRDHQEMRKVVEEGRVDQISPKACRQSVDERFSAKRMAEDYIALYRRIFEGDLW
jgi:glycosyltransferase involved in cell wall biosynthesis